MHLRHTLTVSGFQDTHANLVRATQTANERGYSSLYDSQRLLFLEERESERWTPVAGSEAWRKRLLR